MTVLESLNPAASFQLIFKHWDLFCQLIRRNMAARYRGSLLGMTWCVMQPLVMLSVYTYVFSFVLKAKFGAVGGDSKGSFAIIMFCGMAVFNIFSEAVATSCTVVVNNPNLVKKVIFPLALLPLAQVMSSFLFSMVWFVLLLIGAIPILHCLSWTMLLLPLTLLPLLLFTMGLSFFVAATGVYIRDLTHLVQVVIQILFFMTPIFYPITAIPECFRWVLYLNPLSWFVEETRKVLLYSQTPDFPGCLIALVGALVVFQLGFAWLEKTKKGFSDVL